MNKNYQLIDKTYQQSNSMLLNILISIILCNFATSTFYKIAKAPLCNNSQK